MSEYQRYEFMTIDRPLTSAQLDRVNALSSHISASATHAVIEYNWGDFKHDPIKVLYEFFDGFLYWANWGSPQLALRFPHGVLPAKLIDGYDLEDFVTFTRHSDYDILAISFGEMEPPDEWTDYELGSFISIRDELMEGDLRALYIVWLAGQSMLGSYDEEEDYEISVPPVPPAFGKLTPAQRALAELLRVPQELLVATALHSQKPTRSTDDDFAAWIKLLSPERSNAYLLRLARNEPGLSRLFVKELRELNRSKADEASPTGERVSYATLLSESKAIQAQKERKEREQQEAARQRHLEEVHERREMYWSQIEQAAARGSTGYDEAVRLLSDLRDASNRFQTRPEFQRRFAAWVQPYLRRTSLIKRLRDSEFTWI